MRIILFTGKGGVGKTSISVATAIKSAEFGHKTLIVSCDPAHSLADSLDQEIGDKPVRVKKNLYAQEIDVQKEMEENWGLVKGHMQPFLKLKGIKGILAEELAIIPGLEEVFSLLEIAEHTKSGKFEVIILDSAPTASALRLLSFPEVMGWWVRNIFGIFNLPKTQTLKFLKPFTKTFFSADTDEEAILTALTTVRGLYKKIRKLKKILQDSQQTSIRLVLNLEKMVIEEGKRVYSYLSLFGMPVDAIMVNKIMPEHVKLPYFDKWKKIQGKYLQEVYAAFEPLPIFQIPLFKQELVGEKILQEFSSKIYAQKDPVKTFYQKCPMKFEKVEDVLVLSLSLPFVQKEKIDLIPRREELIIKIGSYKHSVILPASLGYYQTIDATLEEEILKIYFKKKEKTA